MPAPSESNMWHVVFSQISHNSIFCSTCFSYHGTLLFVPPRGGVVSLLLGLGQHWLTPLWTNAEDVVLCGSQRWGSSAFLGNTCSVPLSCLGNSPLCFRKPRRAHAERPQKDTLKPRKEKEVLPPHLDFLNPWLLESVRYNKTIVDLNN